jgi:hypothetical protein
MRSRAFVVAVAAASALIAAAGAVIVGAAETGSTAKGAKTTITIASYDDGLLGTVASPAERCASDRKVKVFRQQGDQQKPKSDKVIGTTTARERHGLSQWSLNKGTSGRFYAKAGKREGCRPAFSDTYRVQPRGGIPLCPSHQEVCQIDQIHIDLEIAPGFPCPKDFGDGTFGACGGNAETGRYWGGVPHGASWTWLTLDKAKVQSVSYAASGYSSREPYGGHINGIVPVGTKAFYVIEAENSKSDFFYDDFYTPSTPGVDPGSQGGPLYLEYTPGNLVIRGFLYNRCNQGCQ